MTEKPILFSSEMVRAILDGRKTTTRRVMKPQPDTTHNGEPYWYVGGLRVGHITNPKSERLGNNPLNCPYGKPGDRLWVRETWVELMHTSPSTDRPLTITEGEKLIEHATMNPDGGWYYDGKVIAYRANSNIEFCDGDGFSDDMANREDMPRWRPSIHMPRWASRITLEVTDVRVERVQDISEEDAIAEGFALAGCGGEGPVRTFSRMWDQINARRGYSWESNPFVWCVTFRRIE